MFLRASAREHLVMRSSGVAIALLVVLGATESVAERATALPDAARHTVKKHAAAPKRPIPSRRLNIQQVNDPAVAEMVGPGSKGAAVIRAFVLLARVKFSPGQIGSAYT